MSTLAKLFALATDDEQSELLNEAGLTLRRSADSELMADMQLSRVADKLDVHGQWFVTRLAEFLNHQREVRR